MITVPKFSFCLFVFVFVIIVVVHDVILNLIAFLVTANIGSSQREERREKFVRR